MEVLFDSVTQMLAEIVVVALGIIGTLALNKIKGYYSTLKKRDELMILDTVTDIAAEYAEKELKGEAGLEKRDFAIDYALRILAEKGIKVNEEEVRAGVASGVSKLKEINKTK